MITNAILAALTAASLMLSQLTGPPPDRGIGGPVILALGDSITYGTGDEARGGYRGPLHSLLRGRVTWTGSQGTRPMLHEGHGGWTIEQLSARAREWAAPYRLSLVLLDAGTNDARQGASGAVMLARMAALLDELRAVGPCSMIIVVAKITITTQATAQQQAEEMTFNAGLDALAASRRLVRTVDMTGVELGDGIHPNRTGYQQMAERWFRLIPKGNGVVGVPC